MTLLQNKLLEMLIWLDSFLRKNQLVYYVDFGTLLGAARHKGFIPWDDDIDISMPRPDYEILCKLLEKPVDHFVVESLSSGNPDYYYTYAKLYDIDTTMTEKNRYSLTRGVFIDIFPIDGIGHSLREALKGYRHFRRMNDFLMTRVCAYNKNRLFYKNIAITVSRLIPDSFIATRKISIRIERFLKKLNYNDCKYLLSSDFMFERDLTDDLCELQFEGINVFAPKRFDEYLTKCFGDWRKLPPVEDQKTTHTFSSVNLNKSFLK